MTRNQIAQLRNLGPKSAEMLALVGITAPQQIRNLGSVACYLLVRTKVSTVSLNLLWAIEGYLQDRDWRDVTPKRKKELLNELEFQQQ